MPAQKPAKTAAKPTDKKTKRQRPKKQENPLFVARPKNFGIGRNVQPKRDLTRVVHWPKYIRLQRQKKILLTRLKVPPAINQFTHTLAKDNAIQLFRLADKYKPENSAARKKRLEEAAKMKKEQGKLAKPPARPLQIRAGVNEVTGLVERKKAKLVVIAHDVNPLEIVLWLPALCRKQGVPYCIVKGKSRLGQVVGRSTCSCFAFTNVHKEDQPVFSKLCEIANSVFNQNTEIRRQWGGLKLGPKTIAVLKQRRRLAAKEEGAKIMG